MGLSFHCLSGCARAPEATALLLATDREPELDQVQPAAHQVTLELRRLAHELFVLGFVAEAHDALDAGPVVPRAIEQHDLAAGGQVLDVALEVPLTALLIGRLFEGRRRGHHED